MSKEIEKKYFLPSFPQELINSGEIIVREVWTIEQTYLALTEREEIRIRKIQIEKEQQRSVTYTHTYKNGTGVEREEIEYQISAELYRQLRGERKPLVKVRTVVEYLGKTFEIDEYKGFDFMTVEVEFKAKEEAEAFVPPHWFGEEVGSKKEYRNKTLWLSLQNQS